MNGSVLGVLLLFHIIFYRLLYLLWYFICKNWNKNFFFDTYSINFITIEFSIHIMLQNPGIYFPEIKLPFLDRQLVSCAVFGIPATIVLNKVDLYRDEAPEQVERFKHIYTDAGYQVIETSARTGEGIQTLRELCKGQVVLFSGESGVGKSSLIKAIDPSLNPKTGEISLAHLQGKHTTSLYEMYPLGSGGYVVDTPGLRGFGLYGLEKEEIAKYFPEMLRVADQCRFVPCTHTHEPGCAVKQAVEEGAISAERYNSYLGMLEEDSKFRQ